MTKICCFTPTHPAARDDGCRHPAWSCVKCPSTCVFAPSTLRREVDVVHLAKQRRLYSEAPLECVIEPRDRSDTGPRGNRLQRQIGGEQCPRGIKPNILDEVSGRLPGCRSELSIECPFRQASPCGQRRYV